MLYLYFFGALLVIALIWAIGRTPGPKQDAENRRASQVADRSSAQAQFGEDAREQ